MRIDLAEDFSHDAFPEGATIVHLAALAHVDYSRYFPDQVLHNNIQSTLNILKVARSRQCRLLFGSSVEVYGSTQNEAVDEDSAMMPLSPYAASKAACEPIVRNYLDRFEIDGTIVRFTNLFGPWQLPDRIIPRLIGQSLMGIQGEVDPGRNRDYLYVQDAIAALMTIIRNNIWDRLPYNISSGTASQNLEIADLVGSLSNGRSRIRRTGCRGNDGRGDSLVISPQRLMRRTGWQPIVALAEGVSRTHEWYARNDGWLSQFEPILRSDRSRPDFLADFAARHPARRQTPLRPR
jgi:dTDP-glucose 4,6-dehydratase